jgi:hypothetical protein
MKHLMGVYQVCSNKSPWVKIGPAGGRGGCHIQVSDFRAIIALLFKDLFPFRKRKKVEHCPCPAMALVLFCCVLAISTDYSYTVQHITS